jgi:hypothetical protein
LGDAGGTVASGRKSPPRFFVMPDLIRDPDALRAFFFAVHLDFDLREDDGNWWKALGLLSGEWSDS